MSQSSVPASSATAAATHTSTISNLPTAQTGAPDSSAQSKVESSSLENSINQEKVLMPAPTPTVNVWGKKKSVASPSTSNTNKAVLSWPTPKDATENSSRISVQQNSESPVSQNPSIRIKKTDKWVPFNANIVINGSDSKHKKNKRSNKNKNKSNAASDNGNATISTTGYNDSSKERNTSNHKENYKSSSHGINNGASSANNSIKISKKTAKAGSVQANGTKTLSSSNTNTNTNVEVESKIDEINKQIDGLTLSAEPRFTNSESDSLTSPDSKKEIITNEAQHELSEKFTNGDLDVQNDKNFNSQRIQQQPNNFNQNNFKRRYNNSHNNNPNSSRNNSFRNNFRNNGAQPFLPNYPFMIPFNSYNYGYPQQHIPFINPQQSQQPLPPPPQQQQSQQQQQQQQHHHHHHHQHQQQQLQQQNKPNVKGNRKLSTQSNGTDKTSPDSPTLQLVDPNLIYTPYPPFAYAPQFIQPIDSPLNLVKQQISYYFSLENLLKDIYLRKLMDDEGAIKVETLSQFNRVKLLTGGDITLLISAIKTCDELEMLNNDEKVRLQSGWESWILPKDQRVN